MTRLTTMAAMPASTFGVKRTCTFLRNVYSEAISLSSPTVQLLPGGLIVDTFFDLRSKRSNIKQALTVRVGPAFDAQLLTKRFIFGANFYQPNYRVLRLNLRKLWKDKSDEIDHKCEEHRPHSGLYVGVNATRYFPYFR